MRSAITGMIGAWTDWRRWDSGMGNLLADNWRVDRVGGSVARMAGIDYAAQLFVFATLPRRRKSSRPMPRHIPLRILGQGALLLPKTAGTEKLGLTSGAVECISCTMRPRTYFLVMRPICIR
jgi:hypothetical protein